MFRKKKSQAPAHDRPVLRGRVVSGSSAGGDSNRETNPLARRFRADDEPATVDLGGPVRFPEAADESADPGTMPLQPLPPGLGRVISRDPGSGKFYVHPGAEDAPVLLAGEAVRAPTELRAGDVIRIGVLELRIARF